jgi:hypothetical protein
MSLSYQLTTDNKVGQQSIPENVLKLEETHNITLIPLTLEYKAFYTGVQSDENSHRLFDLDLKRIFAGFVFKNLKSGELYPQFKKYNIKPKELTNFMKKCVMYSMVVYEDSTSFPMTLEWSFSHADLSFVQPYAPNGRSNTVSEVEKVTWRTQEKPLELIVGHGVPRSNVGSTLYVLNHHKDLMDLLHPNSKHPNRMTTTMGKLSQEVIFVERNSIHRDFFRWLVEDYVENAKFPVLKNKEVVDRYVLKGNEDKDLWRVDCKLLRDAFSRSFMPIEQLPKYHAEHMGLPKKLKVQIDPFDARISQRSVSLSAVTSIERKAIIKIILFVVLPVH